MYKRQVDVQFKSASRKTVVGIILVVALIAFEIFNFDTTRFALNSILGEVSFVGITWATRTAAHTPTTIQTVTRRT